MKLLSIPDSCFLFECLFKTLSSFALLSFIVSLSFVFHWSVSLLMSFEIGRFVDIFLVLWDCVHHIRTLRSKVLGIRVRKWMAFWRISLQHIHRKSKILKIAIKSHNPFMDAMHTLKVDYVERWKGKEKFLWRCRWMIITLIIKFVSKGENLV